MVRWSEWDSLDSRCTVEGPEIAMVKHPELVLNKQMMSLGEEALKKKLLGVKQFINLIS